MLFKVEMKVNIPHDMPADVATEVKTLEKAYAQDLQQQGKWRHLWRVAGSYANVSIFDVAVPLYGYFRRTPVPSPVLYP